MEEIRVIDYENPMDYKSKNYWKSGELKKILEGIKEYSKKYPYPVKVEPKLMATEEEKITLPVTDRRVLLENGIVFPYTSWNFKYKWTETAEDTTILQIDDPDAKILFQVSFKYDSDGLTKVCVMILDMTKDITGGSYVPSMNTLYVTEDLTNNNYILKNLIPTLNNFIKDNKDFWS
jgi:hypothetical protein